MKYVYLHPLAFDMLEWNNENELRALVLSHPERREYSIEDFAIAFNNSELSDLGRIEIVEANNLDINTLTTILDDIQQDLADYQSENGIGTRDENQWKDSFIDKVIASITSYEYLNK